MHCFGTLKFCLHPLSLQVLPDISNNRHLAKYIRAVAISTKHFGLVDPLHKEVAKAKASVHPKSAMPPLDVEELTRTRTRLDSATLAQALRRFPHIEKTLIGAAPRLGSSSVRRTWGAKRVKTFKCPSGHCHEVHQASTVFSLFQLVRVVGMALEQSACAATMTLSFNGDGFFGSANRRNDQLLVCKYSS